VTGAWRWTSRFASGIDVVRKILVFAVLALGMVTALRAAQPVVTAIEVRADTKIDRAEMLHVLGLVAGKPVDRVRLRQGIRALYAGGSFESLAVTAKPAPGGVLVTIAARLRPRVASVRLEGVGVVWRVRIRSWVHVHRRDFFSPAAVRTTVDRVKRELARRSYIDAAVDPEVNYRPETNTVDVIFHISLGSAARAAGITLKGAPEGAAGIAKAARLKRGKKLTEVRLDQVRDRIEAALRGAGYWEAEVLDTRELREPHGFRVVVRVDPGPAYTFDVSMPGAPKQKKVIERALPDPASEPIHPAQINAVTEKIRTNVQSMGYLLARVQARLDTSRTPYVLALKIDLGPRCIIRKVLFPGNHHLRVKKLREAVKVHPGKTSGLLAQTVNDQTLEDDRAALEALYRHNGFAKVSVATPRIEALGGALVAISFPIAEGRRWHVERILFDGFPVEAAPVIESGTLPLGEGRPWDPSLLEPERRALETALENRGYPDAAVRVTKNVPQPGSVIVRFVAVPGDWVTISEVVISGLYVTRDSVVRGVLNRAGLRAGIPYSLETILTAQRKLYELGIFRMVDIVPIPGQDRGRRRGFVVRCTEGLQRSFLMGVGWDTTNKAHITLGWSDLNLFGGAHALSVQMRFSSREETYRATLREPNVPGLGVPAYASVYRTYEKFTSFSQTRHGFWLDLGDRRKRPFRLWWRAEYQIVEPNAPPDILSDLERENQKARIASLRPTLEWDTRDDPFLPTKGIFASASAQYAFPVLNADARFFKVRTSFSLYGRLPGGIGALGVRLGAIYPIANHSAQPENLQVPIGVRFFAGGSASNRAFPTDDLGIPGQTLDTLGNPIGGNALVLINMEYRRKVHGILSAVLFVDGGNVWASPNRVNWNDMRWGVGIGLRIDTPAGPLRLDYGRKVHRRNGESAGELFLAFGVPF